MFADLEQMTHASVQASSAQRCPSLTPCCPGLPLRTREKPPSPRPRWHALAFTSASDATMHLLSGPGLSLAGEFLGASVPPPQRGACPAQFPAAGLQQAESSATKWPMAMVGAWGWLRAFVCLSPAPFGGQRRWSARLGEEPVLKLPFFH